MKINLKLYIIFIVIVCHIFPTISCSSMTNEVPKQNEIVLTKGQEIKAKNDFGEITIRAGKGLLRFYSWEGATRSVKMIPRKKRWYGSLGIYYPGDGNHWKEHNRITRGVLEEGQQHFKSLSQAINWIRKFTDITYRDDGLAVRYSYSIRPDSGPGSTIFVSVWQIYINGEKPEKLPGSSNNLISIN